MHIFQQAETPQGAACNCHRVHRVEIIDGKVLLTLNSYATEQSDLPTWQDTYDMPITAFTKGSYPDNVYAFLTGSEGPFSGAALIEDPTSLNAEKTRLYSEIKYMRDAQITGGCNTPSGRIDTDEVSMRNILGVYQSAVVAQINSGAFSVTWRMADNSSVSLSAKDAISMGNAVLAHTEGCYQRSWMLKELTDTAPKEDLPNIRMMLGRDWPV